MLRVPVPSDGYPSQLTQVLIDDAYYTVIWRWNERDSCWYFAFADADGERILSGVRVVLGADLLSGMPRGAGPDGAIVVIDASGRVDEPGLHDLGNRVQVIYMARSELAGAT